MHLNSRSIWRLAHPCVQIFALARLEEKNIVAVVEFSELVQLVELGLGVELCFLATVREEGSNIV